jgi:hypothetical protein
MTFLPNSIEHFSDVAYSSTMKMQAAGSYKNFGNYSSDLFWAYLLLEMS